MDKSTVFVKINFIVIYVTCQRAFFMFGYVAAMQTKEPELKSHRLFVVFMSHIDANQIPS